METEKRPTILAGDDFLNLCDTLKNNHQILMAVGTFFQELGLNEASNGNGLLADFKKWGIRTIASQVLEKQMTLINQISDIYQEQQETLYDRERQ